MKVEKKWLFSFILFNLFYYGLCVSAYYLIDPRQEFGNYILPKKFKYTRYFSKTLYNKLKYDSYSLAFGTSRNHLMDDQMIQGNLLNLHSIYGNPYSILAFLQSLTNTQIINIRRIYYMIDFHILDGNREKTIYNNVAIDYQHDGFSWNQLSELLIIDLNKLQDVASNIKNNLLGSDFYLSPNGSKIIKTTNHLAINEKIKGIDAQFYDLEGIMGVIKIQQFCAQHGIQLTIFTPTLPISYLKMVDIKKLFNKWNDLLDNGLESFMALWFLEDISNKINNDHYVAFFDDSHLNYEYMNHVFKHYIHSTNHAFRIMNKNMLHEYFKYLEKKIQESTLPSGKSTASPTQ